MTKQPNILLITSDQQRFDTIGPRQPSFLRTPHMTRLCHEGIRFDHAYAESPVCVPARRSIMTGRSVFTSRADLSKAWEIPDTIHTLPGAMREQGYHTSLIGKAHFGPPFIRYGFDEMVTADQYYRDMARRGFDVQPMRHGLGQTQVYPGLATVPEALTLTSWTAEQAVEFIRYRRDPSQPFFIWLSFHKPHPPFDPPEPYYSMYRDCDVGQPAMGDWCDDAHCPPSFAHLRQKQNHDLVPPELNKDIRAAYYGLITQVDYNIGRVFQALGDAGLYNETMMLFTSDHGEYLGDHGCYGKGSSLEGSARLPWIFRPPPSWQSDRVGTVEDALVTHADILPTLVRAAGGKPPEWSDGQDLIGLLAGEVPPREALSLSWMENSYWFEGYNQPDYIAITDGRWKYIWHPEGSRELLFDLAADPTEIHNLADLPAHAAEKKRLRKMLIADQIKCGTTAVKDGDLVGIPEQVQDLRQLRAKAWSGDHGDRSHGDILH